MIPDLWHDVMYAANDRPDHGQVIRKGSWRQVVPLYNSQRKEWVFVVVCWCMDLYACTFRVILTWRWMYGGKEISARPYTIL